MWDNIKILSESRKMGIYESKSIVMLVLFHHCFGIIPGSAWILLLTLCSELILDGSWASSIYYAGVQTQARHM